VKPSAIRLAKRIERYDPLWFEEPCPPDQTDALGIVARNTSIPIATGERLTTKHEFHKALQNGVSILQPDVGRSGGIWETKKIAAIAELYNAQVAPHIYCGPIAHAAAAHVAFSSPSFLILETIQTEFHHRVLSSRLQWENGFMLAPNSAGLGIDEQSIDHRRNRIKDYRIGGAYSTPPLVHNSFTPRLSPKAVSTPTLRA